MGGERHPNERQGSVSKGCKTKPSFWMLLGVWDKLGVYNEALCSAVGESAWIVRRDAPSLRSPSNTFF